MNRIPFANFGLIGRIALNRDDNFAKHILSSFKEVEQSVVIVWRGEYLSAIAVQHPEDARQSPGIYEAQPTLDGSIEGIIYGHFFSDSRPQENQRVPVALSYSWVKRYVREGISGLDMLNGAWVAIFWDNSRHRLLVARDAVGIETVYVARSDREILFATDLRLLRSIENNYSIDEQALAEFLHFLYIPSPRTIYRGITSVLPGHALVIEDEKVTQQPYATPRFRLGRSISDPNELDAILASELPRFEKHLFDAVQDSLPTSGRVGLLLSGGKDSSALAIALKHLAGSRTLAITVSNPNRQLDESTYASRIAKFLGLEHFIYNPTDDELFVTANELFSGLGQPVGDPAIIPLVAMFRRLPEEISVIFDGTGNDYYFGITRPIGRKIYEWRRMFDRFVPKIFQPALLGVLKYAPSTVGYVAKAWMRPIEESFVSWNGWTEDELEKLLRHQVSFTDTYLWQTMQHLGTQGWLALQTQIICNIWEPHAAYAKVVCAARETGKSFRFPFVDNRLARFVNALPQPLQFEGATNKVLLRAFLRKHLPPELLQRPKGSFILERTRLLEYSNRIWLESLTRDNSLISALGWSKSEIERTVRRYSKHPREYADRLYALCLLAIWWKSNTEDNVLG